MQDADDPQADPQHKKENLNKAYSILTDPSVSYYFYIYITCVDMHACIHADTERKKEKF